MTDENQLTSRQAYLAMFEFLRRHYERGPTDEIGGLLGSLSVLADGTSADPAYANDWAEAVAAVLTAESNGRHAEAEFRIV
ncbi:hypothetical protein [Limnoglobus roseus]|uniref:Uncharacterized protein n=1 Tax=Limnoglobus roseus TaxID=2598579 RepID=A0A5C1ARD4_9BACT|nr:hypothetical protein [Limnoglobus roseus]QEL20302.1 hypothetical protein PX52LOC_07394 [Limnoglobus roseus]